MKKPLTIKASELGSYLYCKRAWWYRFKGIESGNLEDLVRGTTFHQEHGRRVLAARLLRLGGWLLLLLAVTLIAIVLTMEWIN